MGASASWNTQGQSRPVQELLYLYVVWYGFTVIETAASTFWPKDRYLEEEYDMFKQSIIQWSSHLKFVR